MSAKEHHRYAVHHAGQHPYKHTLEDFAYTHPSVSGLVTTVQGAMDWLFAVLYPQSQAAVATVGDLPTVGNTLNDYRVVEDDGDGKAAGYRWEQREGELSPSWHKIYDMDWGSDAVLEAFQNRTQDLYVHRQGYDDLDENGDVVTGTLAGQRIFGGKTANSSLTLSANSGDGTGAQTGYVQFTDNVRPTSDSAYSLGTTSERWLKVWADEATFGTLTLAGGSITDSSGAVDFDDEDLLTTGSFIAGTLSLGAGSIEDTSGTIDFGATHLVTTGDIDADVFTGSGASSFGSGTSVGTLTFADGSITDSTGAISFDDENLSTTGSVTGGELNADNLRLDGNTLSSQDVNGNILLVPNGTGLVDIQSALTVLDVTATGLVDVIGTLTVDDMQLDGNTLSSTGSNLNVILDPHGTGFVEAAANVIPSTDGNLDLGGTSNKWGKLWLDGSIGDGTTEISYATLASLRDILTGVSSGDALFYDGSKWVASAPDTEIDHGTVSGLSDDDHSQYALLAGRSSGQTLTGGTGASENLTLESTSNGTKGSIRASSNLIATTNASYSGGWVGTDLGGVSNRFRHVYTAGEFFGLRLENLASAPSSSSQRSGRLYFDTVLGKVYVDTGSAIEKVGANRYEEDTVWNGSDSSKSVTVSGLDARKAIWQLRDNTNNFEVLHVPITSTSATNVTITLNGPLPAGSYRLIGIE